MAEPKALESSLNKLSLESKPTKASPSLRSSNNPNNNHNKKKQDISDSWEDEELEDSDGDAVRPLSPQQSVDYPAAPPPTPISPPPSFTRENFINPYGYSTGGTSDGVVERASARPEKTDAVAKRMIAGALGVRAPKKTDEQRAYDRAIKEKEIKRKNLEKEAVMRAKEEAERQKAAVWDD